MKQFYVYGLIDPRTNSIFYIGKGKGKRVFQHLNEKEGVHSNTEKLKIIREIQKEGLEVEHILIGENLSEDASLLLERILIYRIGRKVFDEGCLTNIVPGGHWHKEAPLFLKKEDIPSIKTITAQFPELIPILENHPHVATEFTSLKCPSNPEDEALYVFEGTGEKLYEWDINYFIQIFGLGTALALINVLKSVSNPVYAWNRVWSKSNFERLENVSKIPFQEFDVIDLDFVRQVNSSIVKGENIFLQCLYPNGNTHIEAQLSSNSSEISLTYYYPNGNKKHITNCLERMLNGKCLSWHPNKQLREEVDYFKNKPLGKQCYFPSGNIEMTEYYNEDGTGKSAKTWYDNGQLRFENNEDGTSFSYSETGVVLLKGIRVGHFSEGGNLITWEYTEDGKLKKETKQYYVDRLLHGYERSFYDTGEIKREVDYTNGHNNKITKTYKKNGEVTTK